MSLFSTDGKTTMHIHVREECPKCKGSKIDDKYPSGEINGQTLYISCSTCGGTGLYEFWISLGDLKERLEEDNEIRN